MANCVRDMVCAFLALSNIFLTDATVAAGVSWEYASLAQDVSVLQVHLGIPAVAGEPGARMRRDLNSNDKMSSPGIRDGDVTTSSHGQTVVATAQLRPTAPTTAASNSSGDNNSSITTPAVASKPTTTKTNGSTTPVTVVSTTKSSTTGRHSTVSLSTLSTTGRPSMTTKSTTTRPSTVSMSTKSTTAGPATTTKSTTTRPSTVSMSTKSTTAGPATTTKSTTTRPSTVTPTKKPSTTRPTTAAAPDVTTMKTHVHNERNHTYYKSRLVTGSEALDFFVSYDDMEKHGRITHWLLSSAYSTAYTMPISFTFPFYGHEIRAVSIATGGFLYMSDFIYRWLTATQYIAPLMANFDMSLKNISHVHYADNGTALIVLWENVHLNDNIEAGPFTFEVILHHDGTIIFVYDEIPIDVASISAYNHPVKVGLADAYYIDSDFVNGRPTLRTIYQYHRVKMNKSEIASHTAIVITPLPTCNTYKSCDECLTSPAPSEFVCMWCQDVGRCSSGWDRKRQEWLENDCHLVDMTVEQCIDSTPATNRSTSPPTPHTSPSTPHPATSTSPPRATSTSPTVVAEQTQGTTRAKAGVIFTVLLLLCFVCSLASWIIYAYLNPHSKSGLWLMKHRPSILRKQLGRVWYRKDRQTAINDRYSVSIETPSSTIA